MQSVLRQEPYNLEYADLVVAKILSRNAIGWAESFSAPNDVGAQIQVLPSTMEDPYEGVATDDTRVQVVWNELIEENTGGSAILSYNLEMMIGGVMTEIVGQTTYYQDTSYLIQTGIQSGQSYSFRVRGRNKWGYGPYSNIVLIEASTNPDTQISTPTLINSGQNIVISWPEPEDKGSAILEYQILIIAESKTNPEFDIDAIDMDCDGASALVIESRTCTIAVVDFRSKFNLDYPDQVFAKIRSRN